MVGESLAFRRVGLGAPISEYGRLIDRARVNRGGLGPGMSSSSDTSTSFSRVVVTASATPHTKGAYATLIASTDVNAETIVLTLVNSIGSSGVDTSILMDIAFGAAASEVVKIANIPIGFTLAGKTLTIPFAVPSGTRISACIQGAVVSQTANIACEVRQSGNHSAAPTSSVTYNADTATSNATTPMTVVGGANAKGAWTELSATTSADIRELLVGITLPATGAITACNALIDVGFGAVASEVVVASNVPVVVNSTESLTIGGNNYPYTASIPAGSRLVARYQATSTATAARPNVIVTGLN